MTHPVIELYPNTTPAIRKRQRQHRGFELVSFVLEAFVTVGILVSFLLCAVLFLCIV